MGRSLHKDTFDFLKRCSIIPVRGSHLNRLTKFAAMINSCIKSKRCSLEGISQGESGDPRQLESIISQSKRWLKSKYTDWETFVAPYLQPLVKHISQGGELILILDGSLTGQNCTTLMLSVVWKKHAIPLVWHTRKGPKGHFSDEAHTDLVKKSLSILPVATQCRVVLLGDGEFDGDLLLSFCQDNQWEFVLRTALNRQVDCGDHELVRIDSLEPLLANNKVIFIENAYQAAYNVILWREKGYQDPIPLLTNMELGEMACQYYRYRFKIETMFKQFKSAGFHLDKSRVESPQRIQNLLIVLALAFLFTFCIGLLIKECEHAVVSCFTRKDRLKNTPPITLTHKALKSESDLPYYLFSILSKNFHDFFSCFT
jgi:Transposase DDE domain